MTAAKPSITFNLPYNQSSTYWLALFSVPDNTSFQADIVAYGMRIIPGIPQAYVMRLSQPWQEAWKSVHALLAKHGAATQVEVALIPGEQEPKKDDYTHSRKQPSILDTLSESLWLGNAMLEDRIVCYMQPVLDKRSKVFGYEAFARVETEKGVIAGGKIIEAGRGLNAEYALDRHLHIKAITSFIESDLEGFLFVNFMPGFIHRPEKYLEGLTETARIYGMPAKQIVLDLTESEATSDMNHVKAIFDYCRSKGYLLSLDDITSAAMAKKIFESIRPDFIKLDIGLVRESAHPEHQKNIAELVALAKTSGCTVIAEGVETEAMHTALLKVGVDLFQGYLFSPPVAVAKLKKADAS